MVNFLIGKSLVNNPYVWSSLVKLIAFAEDEQRDMSTAAIRCVEALTDKAMYSGGAYTEALWVRNCAGLVKNSIFKVLAKLVIDYPKDHVSNFLAHHLTHVLFIPELLMLLG